jgi:hypothetical protein
MTKYPERSCKHGRCVGHEPEWEQVGRPRYLSYPSLILRRTFSVFRWHCGRPMRRVTKVVDRRCRRCGRQEIVVVEGSPSYLFFVCPCCGYEDTPYAVGLCSSYL